MPKLHLPEVLLYLMLPVACVTPSSEPAPRDIEIDCYAARVNTLPGYFALKCYPDNLTKNPLTLTIDSVRFPNFEEKASVIVPDQPGDSGKFLTESGLSGGAPNINFIRMPVVWSGSSKEALQALFLVQMAQIAGQLSNKLPAAKELKKEYQEQYLLKKSHNLGPMQRSQGMILIKHGTSGVIPETVEFTLSQPDYRSVVVPVKVDIRLLRMRPPEASPVN